MTAVNGKSRIGLRRITHSLFIMKKEDLASLRAGSESCPIRPPRVRFQ